VRLKSGLPGRSEKWKNAPSTEREKKLVLTLTSAKPGNFQGECRGPISRGRHNLHRSRSKPARGRRKGTNETKSLPEGMVKVEGTEKRKLKGYDCRKSKGGKKGEEKIGTSGEVQRRAKVCVD